MPSSLFYAQCDNPLILDSVIIAQSIAIIPTAISYMLPKETGEDQVPRAQWPSEFVTPNNNSPSRCLSYNPRTHTDAIQYAIAAGCTGAKADLWLHSSDLLVGSSFANLDEKHTLQSLYLEPLLAKLQNRPSDTLAQGSSPSQPGLFRDPTQSFILLLEVKTSSHAALPRLVSQLDGLRQKGYLTRLDGEKVIPGPVTVVITGHGSVERAYHDEIFFDVSLDELAMEDYDQPWKLSQRKSSSPPSNDTRTPSAAPTDTTKPQKGNHLTHSTIYSATANFHDSIGRPRRGRFSPQQIALIRAQVQAAHRRGLKVRYDAIPQGRGRLCEYIWRVLVQEGADLLDVDWQESYRQAWWHRWFAYRPT